MRNTPLKAFAGSPAKHIRSDRPGEDLSNVLKK